MKKISLIFAGLIAGVTGNAQLTLSGTNYSQDFDNLSNGLPAGWEVYTDATVTSLGSPAVVNTSHVAWSHSAAGFKNFASADGLFAGSSSGDQSASSDRALGIRQSGTTGDPGAAFVLHLANTTGRTGFSLSFKLQSLDATSARTVFWEVDFGTGAVPSYFTTVPAAGTMITGNTTFSNNTVTVFFGNALDNLPGDVWIRIVTLNPSAGVQSRPTTAIDDVLLAWTLTVPDYRPSITALSPPDNSTHVALSSNLVLNFDRQVQKGTGDIHIVNEVSQMLQGIPVNSPDVAISGNTVTVSAISWIPGTPYHVLIDSTAFDTAGYRFPGIYNITDWNFITAPVAAGFLNENFDTACAYNNLPSGWSRHNITGPDQEWSCGGTVDKYMYMNGFSATSNSNDNEDWLITPELDFTNANNPSLHFRTYRGFTGKPLQVYYSTGYPGTGNPNAVSWHNLNINFSNDTTAWTGHSANLPLQQLYIAFKYTCTQAANDCAQWRVDSVVVTEATGVLPVEPDNRMPLTVHGLSTGSHIELGFVAAESGLYTAYVYGLSGREVYRAALSAVKGDNRIVLRPSSLSTGVFIICVSGKTDYGVTKVVVQ